MAKDALIALVKALLLGTLAAVTYTDASNRVVASYDPALNAITCQVFGHPPGPAFPGGTRILLAEERVSFDELSRPFRVDQPLFLPFGTTLTRPPDLRDGDGDGIVTHFVFVEYDALSRPTHEVEDDGQVTVTVYDGASRTIETQDALGNRVLTAYDPNSNPIRVTAIEVSPEGLVPPETFSAHYVYDQLGRLLRATDNAGRTSTFAYDSRDNLVRRADPPGPCRPLRNSRHLEALKG